MYGRKGKSSIVLVSLVIFFVIFEVTVSNASQGDQTTGFVYFYSSTCFSCQEVAEGIESYFEEGHATKYNVSVGQNLELLNQYCDKYDVSEDERGIVPIAFIGDTYLYGKAEILGRIDGQLESFGINGTKVHALSDLGAGMYGKGNINVGSVILAGLINGLNPCSAAMFLSFLSFPKQQKLC